MDLKRRDGKPDTPQLDTPQKRIDWLMKFIEIQGQINPRPKPGKGFQLKKI